MKNYIILGTCLVIVGICFFETRPPSKPAQHCVIISFAVMPEGSGGVIFSQCPFNYTSSILTEQAIGECIVKFKSMIEQGTTNKYNVAIVSINQIN